MASLNSSNPRTSRFEDTFCGDVMTGRGIDHAMPHPCNSIWLGGDADVVGAAKPLGETASQIVSILTADEDEEPMRSG